MRTVPALVLWLLIAVPAHAQQGQGQSAQATAAAPAAGTPPPSAPTAVSPSSVASPALPVDGPFITLPLLSEKQIRQLIFDVAMQLETAGSYRRLRPEDSTAGTLPAPPPNVIAVTSLAHGASQVLQIGFVALPRRLPQLWIRGASRHGDAMTPSGGVPQDVQAAVHAVLSDGARIMGRLRLADLESRTLLLSYVDVDAALFMLRAMGYSAVTDTEALPRDDWFKGAEIVPGASTVPEPPASAQNAAASSVPSYYNSGSSGPYGSGSGGPRFPAIKNLPTTINFDRLPLIVRVPSTDPRNMGVVGGEPANNNYYREATTSSVPTVAAPLSETVASGAQELLVIYHPDYPEQLYKVRQILQESIDKPARQIVVEGLIVEVSRGNLDSLGVNWVGQKGPRYLSLGTVTPAGNAGSVMSFFHNDVDPVTGNIVHVDKGAFSVFARIEALVRENKAEILSRPSVVTLDNRQATIRVGTDLPVAESISSSNSNNVGYKYRSIPIGILLNVRPRVSEDGQEISMLIDATVSDRSRADDLKITDPDTNVAVMEAPAVQTRRVQTYARIRDNMPLIIGGLMSKTKIRATDRVPLLGKIPFIGPLFGTTQVQDDAREVIIVLTPSVVSENVREAKAQLPKDDPRFDVTGTSLFKEKLRIGAEDVLDSAHFLFNDRFLRYRDIANKAVERRQELATLAPFAQFLGTRVPGEEAFVTGMMYRMLERVNAGDAIPVARLRVFEKDGSLSRPVSVPALLAARGDGNSPESFFALNPGKALTLTFRVARASSAAEDMFMETVPDVRVVECAGRDAWRKTLWDLNQPDERGARHTIVIQEPADLKRLQLAAATRNTVAINGGEDAMRFDRWVAGRMINMQEIAPQWERILDSDVARDFFLGEHYYPFFMQQHVRAIEALDAALRSDALKPVVGAIPAAATAR